MRLSLELQNDQFDLQEIIDVLRMRGHVGDSLVEPRTKSKFEKIGAIELQACMENIHRT
jgi:hypothetical protein